MVSYGIKDLDVNISTSVIVPIIHALLRSINTALTLQHRNTAGI